MSNDAPASDRITPRAQSPQLDARRLPVVTGTVAATIKSGARTIPASAPPAGAAAAAPPRPAKPGKERWPVKTGVDTDAARVGRYTFAGMNSEGIVETTVD